MNRLSSLGVLFFFAALPLLSLAQNKNVTSAINYMKYYEQSKNPEDLLEAKKYIDLAVENEETKLKAKTWFNKGYVYQELYKSTNDKVKVDKRETLEAMLNAFKECIKLDTKADFKSNAEMGFRYALIEMNRLASAAYESRDFVTSYALFTKASLTSQEANMGIDTTAVFNAALSADKAMMYPEAIAAYVRLLELNGKDAENGPRIYGWLASVYQKQNDIANFLLTLEKGRAAFPDDKNLIISELNYYLSSGKTDEAIKNLNLAIQKDPENPVLHYNLGVFYDEMANPKNDSVPANYEELFKKSDDCYNKALAIDSSYYDALFNKGALYYNRGVKQTNKANAITDQKKYDIESKKADEWFAKALPLMLRAERLQPASDAAQKTLYSTLASIYRMMGEMNKEKIYREKSK